MRKSNIFLSAIVLSGVILSGCSENNISVVSGTSVTDPPDVLQTKPVTIQKEWEPDYMILPPSEEENVSKVTFIDDETFIKNYFNEHSFRYENRTIYVDMNKFPDTDDPFENISKDYVNHAYELVLSNVDGRNINFVNDISPWSVTITGYSGKCDFSHINKTIYFDNYMGGDLSTMNERSESKDILRFTNYKGGYDLSAIADMQNIYGIESDNYNSEDDLQFIKECKNLNYLWLENDDIDCEKLAGVLKGSNVNEVFMRTKNYRSSDMDILAKAFPSMEISYNMDDSPWSYDNYPTEGLVFYPNLYINGSAGGESFDSAAGELNNNYVYDSWRHTNELVNVFSNFTDETQTVNTVKIYRDNGGKLAEIPFADGNTSFNADIEIEPETEYHFIIPKDIFPYDKCETGVYKIEFETSYGTLSSNFFIDNTNDKDFLTDEQKEIFDKAYEITNLYFGCESYLPKEYVAEHTAEEFLAPIREAYTDDIAISLSRECGYIDENGELAVTDGSRGSDLTYQYVCFEPIYSDDDEIIFKSIIIHGHEDYPYFTWYEENNFHMVKTEKGWRFDIFQLWY